MKTNNVLDERQESELLKIERNGCWLAFWGLLAAIIIQTIQSPAFAQIAGEWIVFMVLAVYITAACLKRGIWSRTYKPDLKTNAVFSAIAAAVCMVIVFFTAYFRKPEAIKTCLTLAGISGVSIFILILVSLQIAASATKHRRDRLDSEPEDEEETL